MKPLTSTKKHKTSKKGSWMLWRWLLLFIWIGIANFPLLATFLTSLKTNQDINASPPNFIFTPTIEHYMNVLLNPKVLDFHVYLWNSFLIALGGTLLAIGLTLPAAYAIVRFGVGKRFLLVFITNLRTIPLIIYIIPFYIMYQFLGLLDTRLGLMLVAAVINLPMTLIIFVGFFQDFPKSLDEAAMIDGASTLGVIWYIILPLSRTITVSAAILAFITSWNEFLFGLILTTEHAVPVTVGSTFFVTSYGIEWGQTSAAMMLSVLPPMILGIYVYKWLGQTLLGGAIKG